MQFIDEARQAWRLFSVQAMGLAIAIQAAWDALPPTMVSGLPAGLVHKVTIALLLFGIVGRLVKQKPADAPKP